MAVQRESLLIVNPMVVLFESRGWRCINIHGNKFQSGLPDLFMYRVDGKASARWVEFKVVESDGRIKCSQAQKVEFPLMVASGGPYYCIADTDLRGTENYDKRLDHYKRVTQGEPNLKWLLDKSFWPMLPSKKRKRIV